MKKLLLAAIALTAFTGRAQLVNPGFEDWTQDPASPYPYATGWGFYGNTFDMEVGGYFCYQISPAQQGNYAMAVSVWYYYTKSIAAQRAPVNQRYATVQGYYTYTDNVLNSLFEDIIITDTAEVLVYMTRWNEATQQEDTIGHGHLDLHEATNYTHFSCPVEYINDEVPDHIIVIFDPSLVRREEEGPYYMSMSDMGRSSYLTIDNLVLGTTMGLDGNEALSITVYPNPVSDSVSISGVTGNFSASILDITGKTVAQACLDDANTTLSVQDLASGLYVVQVEDGQGRVASKKFVKE